MKTKTKQQKPLTFTQSYFALEEALQRIAREKAGAAWGSDTSAMSLLESDVEDELQELNEAIDRCHENIMQAVANAKRAHTAEIAQSRKRAANAAADGRMANAAAKPVIVHARNPRKIRRDGATR